MLWFPPTFALPLLPWSRSRCTILPFVPTGSLSFRYQLLVSYPLVSLLGRFLWLVADGLTALETPFSSVERRLSGWYPFGLLLWAAVVVFPCFFLLYDLFMLPLCGLYHYPDGDFLGLVMVTTFA